MSISKNSRSWEKEESHWIQLLRNLAEISLVIYTSL